MKQSLTIRIPDDLREELQEISKAESKPVSDLVRESIQKYISIYRFHQLREKVRPFAEAQGILTDEDVSNLLSFTEELEESKTELKTIRLGGIWKDVNITDEDIKEIREDLFTLQMNSEAYSDWVSPENDIYDEVFKDETD
ncbi:MAG: CopG family transcriptional regulator [Candidatus Poribacteria bacterium]|nr:CopG family transcriptional regulator [Candidatus Poribacteria bacterium]